MASQRPTYQRYLAKGLGIELDDERGHDPVTSTTYSSSHAIYMEEEPLIAEGATRVIPSCRDIFNYFYGLFPFLPWITRYTYQWLPGDIVAGITVGAVMVPQGMAYALLANLPPQFGLYSSFMGAATYWIFGTSKDISIGPTAVMSIVTSNIVLAAQTELPQYSHVHAHFLASALGVVAGCIVALLGLLRLGWIIELISLSAISAFVTASALTIALSQVPALLGITGFSTRGSAYENAIHTLEHLGRIKLDAAFGISALVLLYCIRFGCGYVARRYPNRARPFFFLSTLRNVFVILLFTMMSYLVNRNHKEKAVIKIIGKIPIGFEDAAVPTLDADLFMVFLKHVPILVIVILIEHISIAKSFGRINNYKVNASQEMMAIGAANILGPFLGGYPVTGSFSRTAIQSKAGSKTPLCGIATAFLVLLATYALPAMFFYIPKPALSAVIIHAIGDLITPPNTLYRFWKINPWDVVIFFASLFVAFFTTIENGVYTAVGASLGFQIVRMLHANGHFIGKARVRYVSRNSQQPTRVNNRQASGEIKTRVSDPRTVFLPLDRHDGSNPQIQLEQPYPGVFIYRLSEGFNYLNANHYLEPMVEIIFKETKRTKAVVYERPGDRPWSAPTAISMREDATLPTLRAIILDFSSVAQVDATSIQALVDVRNQLDLYTSPEPIEWHIACIQNRWTKRALAAAGFGWHNRERIKESTKVAMYWQPVFSADDVDASLTDTAMKRVTARQELHIEKADLKNSAIRTENLEENQGRSKEWRIAGKRGDKVETEREIEVVDTDVVAVRGNVGMSVTGVNWPLFHIDLHAAVEAAVGALERKAGGSDLARWI